MDSNSAGMEQGENIQVKQEQQLGQKKTSETRSELQNEKADQKVIPVSISISASTPASPSTSPPTSPSQSQRPQQLRKLQPQQKQFSGYLTDNVWYEIFRQLHYDLGE